MDSVDHFNVAVIELATGDIVVFIKIVGADIDEDQVRCWMA